MNFPLYILDSPDVKKLLERHAFTKDDSDEYHLDSTVMDYLDVGEECPIGYRPVAVHVIPFTRIGDDIFYYAFAKDGLPSIYVSFQIWQDDFLTHKTDDPVMSFCSTVVGKIIRTLDNPLIDMSIDKENFMFPAVIDGEFCWAMEVKGDNHQVIDEMVEGLGTTTGRVSKEQIVNGDVEVNRLSNSIVGYKTDSDDIVI